MATVMSCIEIKTVPFFNSVAPSHPDTITADRSIVLYTLYFFLIVVVLVFTEAI